MKKIAALVLISLIATPLHVQALDWEGSEPRTINVCTHRSLTQQWREWVQESMNKWNEVSETTGWTLRSAPFVASSCDLFIIVQDQKGSQTPAHQLTTLDQLGTSTKPNGKIEGMVLVIDAFLESTTEWLAEQEDTDDGARDGWSTNKAELTFDPIDALLHNFAKAMRIHGEQNLSVPSANISDQRFPGQHLQSISEEDIARAKNSALRESLVTEKTINPQTTEIIGLLNTEIQLQKSAFTGIRSLTIQEANVQNHIEFTATDNRSLQEIKGIFFSIEPTSPLEIRWNIQNPDGVKIYKFQKRIWDVTPLEIENNPSIWEEIEVQIEEGVATFAIDGSGYYAIGRGIKAPMQYQVVKNGKIQTEKHLKTQKTLEKIFLAWAKQLPAFTIGFLSAVAILRTIRKQKKKNAKVSNDDLNQTPESTTETQVPETTELLPNVESDGNSMPDVQGVDSGVMGDEDRGRIDG